MHGPNDPSPGFEAKRPGGEMKSRASEAPTRSQLLPLGGQWQELMTKPYFIPGLVVCVVIALLFTLMSSSSAHVQVMAYGAIPVNIPMYSIVLALCIVGGGAFAVYRMAGKPKAWWLMPAVAVFTALLVSSPVMSMLQGLFGIGGGSAGKGDTFVISFVKMIFRAGLPEESLKAIPVLFGVFLGWKLMIRRDASGMARQFAVLDPLDGILIGVASGFGFAFAETVLQYVPGTIVDSTQTVAGLLMVLQQQGLRIQLPQDTSNIQDIYNLFVLLGKKIGVERATFELQQIIANRQGVGLQLMIPRLLSDVFGHAAYAGIFGYFIGLAALKPVGRVKTILIGLAVAVTIHALWDATTGSAFTYFLLSMVAFVGLAIAIMKARTIAPDRSQLVASQIIDRFAARSARSATASAPVGPAAAPARPTTFATSPQTTGFAPGTPPMGPLPSAAKYQAPAAPLAGSITWDDESNLRIIEVGTARVPASVGARLYERQVPGSHAGAGDSVIAEVSANPNDPNVLGLKNLSDTVWQVTTTSGQQRELLPGRSVRLEAGLAIRIGEMVAHVR